MWKGNGVHSPTKFEAEEQIWKTHKSGYSKPDLKAYYKYSVIKRMWCSCKVGQRDQEKRLESQEIDL